MNLRKTLLESASYRPQVDMRKFSTSEDGSMTIFACFMILIMIIVGGIGVDLMRNEMERTRVQSVADRAVLAAADLDQTLTPSEVVDDYFAKSGLAGYVSSVNVQEGNNFRIVTVDASNTTNTQFMSFLGQDTLPMPVLSTAEERVPKVEISLVLDISSSMNAGTRLPDLQDAAVDFIDTVLADDVKQTTSVSLVPYGGQVNPGPAMFNYLGGQRVPVAALDQAEGGIPEDQSHGILDPAEEGGAGIDPNDTTRYVYPNVSSCPEIHTDGFNSTTLPSNGLYSQTSYFSVWWDTELGAQDVGWCPDDPHAIQYVSNNRDKIKNAIQNFQLYDGTGTHYAMQWALALLNPTSQGDLNALAGQLDIPSEFAARPAPYGDSETLKYIILMTDGGISNQFRPKAAEILNPENVTVRRNSGRHDDFLTLADKSVAYSQFTTLCDLAHSRSPRPIIVYTIAFETRNAAEATAMRDCASSPSHFFQADGASISDTFEAIARQINQLRLTQ